MSRKCLVWRWPVFPDGSTEEFDDNTGVCVAAREGDVGTLTRKGEWLISFEVTREATPQAAGGEGQEKRSV